MIKSNGKKALDILIKCFPNPYFYVSSFNIYNMLLNTCDTLLVTCI